MTIRKINPEDAAAIAVLSAQLGYQLTAEETAAQITAINCSDNDIAFAAADGNKIVGWIHAFYTLRMECAPFCEIGGLIIDEEQRGKGIGRQLTGKVEAWCAQKNCKTLRVRSNTRRTEAHRFYEHLGFSDQKQQKVLLKILD